MKKTFTHLLLTGVFLISMISLVQGQLFNTQPFNPPEPTISAVQTPGAWYPDRYQPAIFESYAFGGGNVLRIGINLSDGAQSRLPSYSSAFYNTQGRKYDLATNATVLFGDLYIPADWATKHRRTDLWATAFNGSAITDYPIIGFANTEGNNPTLRYWDQNSANGWVNISVPIVYDSWYKFAMVLSAGYITYYVNGVQVAYVQSIDGSTSSQYFGNLIVQAYNFNDNTLGVAYDATSNATYDAYWDNIGTGSSPTTIIQEPEFVSCGTYDVPVKVQDFTNVGSISLLMKYNSDSLSYLGATLNPAIAGATALMPVPGTFSLGYFGAGVTLPADAVLFTLHFQLANVCPGTDFDLEWSDVPGDCEYAGPGGDPVYVSSFFDIYYDIPAETTPPVISTCPPSKTIDGCDVSAITPLAYSETSVSVTSAQFTTEGGVATDACGGVATWSYKDSKSGTCPIVVTRVWTVGDACGNTTTCTQTINVNDNTAPVFTTCPADLTINCDDSQLPENTGSAIATDNCSTPTVTYSDAAGQLIPSTFPGGTAIQGRARWGANGFEAALYIGGTSGPNLNPAGTPVWVSDTPYKFEYAYNGTTGDQTLSIDFNNDNSFGAGEVITQATAYAGKGFKHFSIYMTASTGSISLSNFVVNGVNLGNFVSPGTIDKDWENSAGLFSNITATGTITFDGGPGGDESRRIWFRTATPVTPEPPAVTCAGNYIINRVWTAEDACGNISYCVQNITVQDITPPVITLPSTDLSMECFSAAAVDAWTATASALDACQGAVAVVPAYTAPTSNYDQTVVVTFTATDACGNIATATKSFIVDDNTAPEITTCPPVKNIEGCSVDAITPPYSENAISGYSSIKSSTLNYGDGGWGGWSVPSGKVITGGGFQLTGGPAAVSVPAQPNSVWPHYTYGPAEYGWVARDAPDGSASPGSYVYGLYSDLPAGYGIAISPVMNYGDGGWAGWSAPAGKVVIGGGFYATAPVSASCPGQPGEAWPHYTFGANEYGWVVQDAPDGQSNTIYIYVIYCDKPDGYQIVKSSQQNYGPNGWAGWSVPGKLVLGGGFQGVNPVRASRPCMPGETTPFGYTYGPNEYGWLVQSNGGGAGFIYVIYGNLGPMTVTASQFADEGGVASDNCAVATYQYADTKTGTCPIVVTRVWTVGDACGNTTTCTQTINVNDNTAPNLTIPDDVIVDCPNPTDPSVTGTATAIDACSGTVTPTYSDAVGQMIPSTFPGGTAIQGRARWGNTGFEGALYLGGTVGPNLNPAGTPVWVIGTPYQFEYSYDATSGDHTLKIDFNNDLSFGAGEVISQSTSYAGQGFQYFSIFMSGNTTRGITLNNFVVNGVALGNYVSPATGSIDLAWENSAGYFEDILATGTISFTGVGGSGDETGRIWLRTAVPVTIPAIPAVTCAGNYVINRVWTAEDACGNKAIKVQKITVQDLTPPVITLPSTDLSMECFDAALIDAWTATASALDACSVDVTVLASYTAPASNCDQTVVVTFTATDACGNTATETKSFTVDDNTAPVLTVPADVVVDCPDPTDPSATGTATAIDACSGTVTPTYSDAPGQVYLSTDPAPSYEIQGRARNGNTGFEGVLFTPGNPSPTGVQLNPAGAPAWNYALYYNVEFNYTAATGTTEWKIDFNRDGDYLDAQEMATSVSPTLVGKGFKYVGFYMNGNNSGVFIDVQNLTINGTNVGSFLSAANGNATDQYYQNSAGMFTDITVTASIRLSGNGGQETPRLWIRAGVPLDVPATPICAGNHTINRVWSATDACGNKSLKVQNITVQDVTAPVLTNQGANATIYCPATPVFTPPTVNDACDANPEITYVDVTVPAGATLPPYTTTRTWTATDDCGNTSLPVSQSITVSYATITGILSYNNTADTKMNNVTVKLMQGGMQYGTTGTTNANGEYTISEVCAGTYDVVFTTSKPVGGINVTDAAQVNAWGVGPQYSIEKVRFYAGDVNAPADYIDAADAGKILTYFVQLGLPPYDFTKPWTFWKNSETTNTNPIPAEALQVMVSGNITQNFYGLATGDFNRSFVPGGAKSFNENVILNIGGNIMVEPGAAFELPVTAGMDMQIGAVSLILNVPADQLEVTGVYLGTDPTIPMDYSVIGNELRIGWHSLFPPSLATGETLLTLKLRTTEAQSESISLSLTSDPLNELADGNYNTIPNALLFVDEINGTTTGIPGGTLGSKLLLSSYPNPFTDKTTFDYTTPKDGRVVLVITNMLGSQTDVLLDEFQTAGNHTRTVDLSNYTVGVYTATLRLLGNNDVDTRTIKVIRKH